MTKRLLPYVQKEKTRHGKTVYYFRKRRGQGGSYHRTRLPDAYGTKDFMRAYDMCLRELAGTAEAAPPTKNSEIRKPSSTTFGWLLKSYQDSDAFTELADGTQTSRRAIIKKTLEQDIGGQRASEIPLDLITTNAIKRGKEARRKKPNAANNWLKVIKAAFKWAEEAGLIDDDPAKDVRKITVKSDGFHTWTVEEVLQFRARWPIGTRERLGFELFAYTGVRRSDVVRIGPEHVQDNMISIKASKNRAELFIPIFPELQEAIDAIPTKGPAFLMSDHGRPFTAASFGNFFGRACKEAGVPGRAHGIRKAAATIAADNGATTKQLMAVFGWVSPEMAELYTKKADRKRLSVEGIKKLAQS
ncbi:tyrosine-type recombinase/integrase [Pseudovibrio ascidiaceicola]|uniref:tyrosine-type recombinase/integrase n=1 Tax=Pseudovibrio ascidiaceicola TaxID=285279 RepID=UPI003D363CBE